VNLGIENNAARKHRINASLYLEYENRCSLIRLPRPAVRA